MRRFRLLTQDGYHPQGYVKGCVYPEMYCVYEFPEDWQEVFDNDGGTILTTPNPLHKDTDLGYFAGLAMQASDLEAYGNHFGNLWAEKVAADSIAIAKELIKQLDEETK